MSARLSSRRSCSRKSRRTRSISASRSSRRLRTSSLAASSACLRIVSASSVGVGEDLVGQSARGLRSKPRDQIRAGQPDQHTQKQPDETAQGNSSRSPRDQIANRPMIAMNLCRRSGRERARTPSTAQTRSTTHRHGRRDVPVRKEISEGGSTPWKDLTPCSLVSLRCARDLASGRRRTPRPRCTPLLAYTTAVMLADRYRIRLKPGRPTRRRSVRSATLFDPGKTNPSRLDTATQRASAPRSALAKSSSHEGPS